MRYATAKVNLLALAQRGAVLSKASARPRPSAYERLAGMTCVRQASSEKLTKSHCAIAHNLCGSLVTPAYGTVQSTEYTVCCAVCPLLRAAPRKCNATQRARSKFRVHEREQRFSLKRCLFELSFKCALEAHISIAERSATQHAFTSMSHCVMLHNNTTIPYPLPMSTFARPRFASHSLSQSGSFVRAARMSSPFSRFSQTYMHH